MPIVCPECGFETFKTAKEAEADAEAHLDHYRDDAPDGWNDEVTGICWGEVKASVDETERRPFDPATDFGIDPDCEAVVDYGLIAFPEPEPTPQA